MAKREARKKKEEEEKEKEIIELDEEHQDEGD